MTNEVFGTGLTFAQLIISVVLLVVGTIIVKISLNFDINKYLKERQERYSAKCKNACVHFEFVPQDSSILVNSFFVSPSGTMNYICQRCGLTRLHLDQEAHQRSVDYYCKNIKEYNKQNKKFHKLLKKSGNV